MDGVKTTQKTGGDFDLEKVIDAVIRMYPSSGAQKKFRRARRNEIKSMIQILHQADTIVRRMQRFLWLDTDISAITRVLQETAHALHDINIAPGRSAETHLGHCSNLLGRILKQEYGRCHWELVGKAMAREFPGVVLIDNDDEQRLAQWAKGLDKRYRKRQKDPARREIAEFRNGRANLQQRLAQSHPKTLATYFPSLREQKGASFWPDELSIERSKATESIQLSPLTHVPENCSMCVERRKRRDKGKK
jgi:hypothetical protein